MCDTSTSVKSNFDSSNYYHRLGISSNSSQSDVLFAWKQLAAKYHPDRNSTDTTLQFQLLLEAYSTLKDKTLREHYDEYLENLSASISSSQFLPQLNIKWITHDSILVSIESKAEIKDNSEENFILEMKFGSCLQEIYRGSASAILISGLKSFSKTEYTFRIQCKPNNYEFCLQSDIVIFPCFELADKSQKEDNEDSLSNIDSLKDTMTVVNLCDIPILDFPSTQNWEFESYQSLPNFHQEFLPQFVEPIHTLYPQMIQRPQFNHIPSFQNRFTYPIIPNQTTHNFEMSHL